MHFRGAKRQILFLRLYCATLSFYLAMKRVPSNIHAGYFSRLTAVLDDNLATRLIDSEDCTTLMDNDSVVKQLRSILDVLSMDTSTTMDELFTSLKNGCDGVISYLQELAPVILQSPALTA